MADAMCCSEGCESKPHTRGLCWRHLEESRRTAGDLCSVDDCDRGRFYRGMCGTHASKSSRQEHGRKRKEKMCERCGRTWETFRSESRFCSLDCWNFEARQRRLPVPFGSPATMTPLPERHPARQPAPPRSDWWQIVVQGSCAWCRETFTAVAASFEARSLYCSKRCSSASGKSRRGRFLVAPSVRRAIYERDGWVCQLCDDPIDPDLGSSDPWAATLDHIVPRSWTLVPDDSPANLRLAHRWCNSVRGDERYYTEEVLRSGETAA